MRELVREMFIQGGKGFNKLAVGVGVDKVPMQEEFEEAQKGDMDLDKKVVKLNELNELAYKDLILSINTSSSVGKVVFGLTRNAKSLEFLEENCNMSWVHLVHKYAPHTTSSLLKLRNEFTTANWTQLRQILTNGSQVRKKSFKFG